MPTSKVDEPLDFNPGTMDFEAWMPEFNDWMSAMNGGSAYIGFSPLPGIQTAEVMAGAHEYMKNARTKSLLSNRRFKKVGEVGEGADNLAMVLLQKEIYFFLIISRKLKCWEQHFADVSNYTVNCGTNAFLKIIEHHNALPKLRIQLELIKMLTTPPTGDTACSHATSCRAMMKLISRAGKTDASTLGKLFEASSCARSTDAAIAAIGTAALQTTSISLAEMTVKLENYERMALATQLITPQQVLVVSGPTPPRFTATNTPSRSDETCRQC
ncbi:hypothetical protein T484DRAFT_1859016, partial [Baffinella frigidus]